MIDHGRASAHQRLRNGRLERWSNCPKHGADVKLAWVGKRTSLFLGVNEHGWVFRCKESDHTFAAIPPGDRPKSADEVEDWRQQQHQMQLKEMEKHGA